MTTQDDMKEAARKAREELEQLKANSNTVNFDASVGLLASWWESWFQTAGHKRLAYILMNKPYKGE